MNEWADGYVADIGYTYGYYPELNPLRVRLAFLNAGLQPPAIGTACELGFGQGVSINLHAAASGVAWYGTDFNPGQAAFAQELAAASGNDAGLHDDAFADFCQRPDLPEFDFIGLHGVWSWISEANRMTLVDFIRRKLKVGGAVYIGYNTLPGWSTFAPLRHLMTQHADTLGAAGHGIINRIDSALSFAERLLAEKSQFTKANPLLEERLKQIKDQPRQYLAHEYFNRDWCPMYFADLAQKLEPAKAQYACSAHYLDHIDGVNVTAEQRDLLNGITDHMLRETVRDFLVNQQFRRDYWVKGLRRISGLERHEQLWEQKVIFVSHPADVQMKVTTPQGESSLTAAVYEPLLEFLADHKPRTLADIEHKLKPKNLNRRQIIEATMILAGKYLLMPAQEEAIIADCRQVCDRLNHALMLKARSSNEVGHLASPVTGGGIALNRFMQLFLMACKQGKARPDECAQFVWDILQLQDQKIIKDGKALETPEANLQELRIQASAFVDKQLPILKALQIA